MGILVDFLIKHVRPYGDDAWQWVTQSSGLREWLIQKGVAQDDINTAFSAWHITANLPVTDGNLSAFIQAAELISEARWSVLYQTDYSTILFLTEPLLKQLDAEAEMNKGTDFAYKPYEYIPLAVTINSYGARAQTVINAEGAFVSSDANGNCCHLAGLIDS